MIKLFDLLQRSESVRSYRALQHCLKHGIKLRALMQAEWFTALLLLLFEMSSIE